MFKDLLSLVEVSDEHGLGSWHAHVVVHGAAPVHSVERARLLEHRLDNPAHVVVVYYSLL